MAKIKDVAALAGVSDATVSRVLNDVSSVDPALAVRVRDAAESLGYRRNGVARNLRRRRTDVWALIISDIANPFFTAVARGVEDIAQKAGYSVMLCNSDEDPDKEARYLDVAEREQFSGVILSPNIYRTDVSRLVAANIPVVAVDRPMRNRVDSVLVNSQQGARNATSHLLDEGWQRPACVTGPARADTAEKRLAGYLDALHERRRRPSQDLVRHTDYHAAAAREAVASLLDGRRPPDSFFVANATMTLGALEEFASRGCVPGADLGLIAFDDAPWAALMSPSLSVVSQPAYEIGAQAASLLLRRMDPGTASARRKVVTLPTALVVRESSRRRGRIT